MYNQIVRFLKSILPIFGFAFARAAADALSEVAYPRRRDQRGLGYRRMTPYNRMPYSGPRRNVFEKHEVSEDRLKAAGYIPERNKASIDDEPLSIRENNRANGGYHDVIMVAFDISGPSMEATYNWLENHMPGARGYEADQIDIDAWWIADDPNENTDCMSAVFVNKGDQAKARALLREHGLML